MISGHWISGGPAGELVVGGSVEQLWVGRWLVVGGWYNGVALVGGLVVSCQWVDGGPISRSVAFQGSVVL